MEEYIVKNYLFPALEDVAHEKDMHFICEDSSDFFSKSRAAGFSFRPNQPSTWYIAFEFGAGNWYTLEVGLVWDENHRKSRKAMEHLPIFRKKPNDLWFHGWDYVKKGDWDTKYLLDMARNVEEFKQYYRELLSSILDNIKPEKLL